MASIKIGIPSQIFSAKSITPTAIPANSLQTEAFTLKGLTTEMMLEVKCNALPSGLFLVDAWVSAKDQFKLALWNVTGSQITPGALVFLIATL